MKTITAANANRGFSNLLREVDKGEAVTINRCRLLLSEDLQNGFLWNGVTVLNPFSCSGHPLLHGTLRGNDAD